MLASLNCFVAASKRLNNSRLDHIIALARTQHTTKHATTALRTFGISGSSGSSGISGSSGSAGSITRHQDAGLEGTGLKETAWDFRNSVTSDEDAVRASPKASTARASPEISAARASPKASPSSADEATTAMQHTERILSWGTRVPGDEGWLKSVDYIYRHMVGLGWHGILL